MYSTLAEFKEYIGVTDNSQDNMLTWLLQSATELLNKLCGVVTFDKTTAEELVDLRKVYTDYYGLNMYLQNKPVISIDEIDWENYSGVKGTDYVVVNDRKVIFKDRSVNDNFGFMRIKYTWGYDRHATVWDNTVDQLPYDIKLMEMMLASGMYTNKDYQGISSYRLGDESITFWDVRGTSAEDIYFNFKTLLNKYKNFNLPC